LTTSSSPTWNISLNPASPKSPNPELEPSRLTLLPFAADGKSSVSLCSFSQLYFDFNPSHCTQNPICKTPVFHLRNTIPLRSFENQTDSTGMLLSIRVLLRSRDFMSAVGAGFMGFISCFSITPTSAALTGIVHESILGSS
jgi:hypothetical protein